MKVAFNGAEAAAAYSAAFRKLRQLPGFDMPSVLRAEVGSILKRWAGVTKVATATEATLRARYRTAKHVFGSLKGASSNQYGISVNTGARKPWQVGWVWYKKPGAIDITARPAGIIYDSGQFQPNHLHWKAADWARINAGAQAYGAELARLLPLAPRSVGLARQSVIQIADQLGIDLNNVKGQGISSSGISKARTAIASTGKSYQNGVGQQAGDDVRYHITLINRLPQNVKMGMDRQLAGVLSGRAKFIETAYRKGAFDSMSSAARSFPNIFKGVNP